MSSEENKWKKNFDILLDVSKAMSAERDHLKLLELIVTKTTQVLNAERTSLFLLDTKKQELYTRVAEKSEIKEIRVPLGQGIVGYVAKERELIHIPDAYSDERFNQEVDKKTGFRTRNIVCAPLINHKDEVMGSVQVLNKMDGAFTAEDIELLQALASQAAVSLDNANLIEHFLEKEKMAAAMKIASKIQQSLFPDHPPHVERVELYGWSQSCDEVGGDYYDYLTLANGNTAVIIGDVSGHGVGPALIMATVRAFIRALVKQEKNPGKILTLVNELAMKDLKEGMFVTLFLGIIDHRKKKMTYSSAGHDPPVLLRAKTQKVERLTSTGVPIGILPGFEYQQQIIAKLQKNDLILITTDGIWESVNKDEERFGQERVIQSILDHQNDTLSEIRKGLVESLFQFVGEVIPDDDLTVLMARIL